MHTNQEASLLERTEQFGRHELLCWSGRTMTKTSQHLRRTRWRRRRIVSLPSIEQGKVMVWQRRTPRRCKVPKPPNNARKVGPPSTKKSGSPLRRRRSPPTRSTKQPRLGGQAGTADSRKSIGRPNREYICLGVIILFFDFTLLLRSRYDAVRRQGP